MDYNKKISRSGAITLPAALRREYGIEPGEQVNISVNQTGNIIIQRVTGSCTLCKSGIDLKEFNSRFLCVECIRRIARGATWV